MRGGNTPRCARATIAGIVVAITWSCLLVCAARARPDEPAAIQPETNARASIDSFNKVRAWIDEWAVPADPPDIDPPGCWAACVTLRLSGKVVGRASAIRADNPPGRLIGQAAREAWREASRQLPLDRDALFEQNARAMAPTLLLDLQLMGEPIALVGDTWEEAAAGLSPGIDSVAVRAGRAWSVQFAASAMSVGLDPPQALRASASELGDGLSQPKEQRARLGVGGFALYRAPTSHLVQTGPNASPIFLWRGTTLVGLSEVGGARLRASASAAAEHLLSREWPTSDRCGMAGDYVLASGSYEPIIAPALDQAAAAWALSRYARSAGVERSSASRAGRLAERLLADLAVEEPDETPWGTDIAAGAMTLIALEEARRAGLDLASAQPTRQRSAELLASAYAEPAGWSESVPVALRPLVVLALAELGAGHEAVARAAVRALFRDIEPGELVSAMPWLAWAEWRLAGAGEALPAAAAVLEMRSLVHAHRLRTEDLDPRWLDLAGGVSFTRGGAGLPTWTTLRAAAVLGTALGDTRFTPDASLGRELAELTPMLRFLLQLQIGTEGAVLARDPSRAVGGVRPAVWEARASVQATCLALVAICETLDSLERRAASRATP